MQKKRRIRVLALVLAVLLAVSPAALASQALGSEVHFGTAHLAEGLDHTRQYLWSATYSDLRTENYLEYTPGTLVRPVVVYGTSVLSRDTLANMARTLEADGMRVLAGINGDFYDMSTGAPLGLVITDGILRSSSSYVNAVGFNEDGTAFIGCPNLSVTAAFGENTWTVGGGVNKVRDAALGYVLYTEDFNANTYHSSSAHGVDVILTPSAGYNGLTVGGTVACTVDKVLRSTGSIAIPEGKLVLSVNENSEDTLVDALAALEIGDQVTISIAAPDERWETAVTAIGGLYKLVTDGETASGLPNDGQAPRTAVGVREDGTVIFYTIDGRQSGYSVGATLTQVAGRLVELGCTEALALDGGGSTTFGTTQPGQESFSVQNKPSEGVQRAITNALFLVTDRASAGTADRLAVMPGDAAVLAGSKLELSAVAVDAMGRPVRNSVSPSYTVDGGGTVSGSTFTAGDREGCYTVTASADGLTGTAQITVVTVPDRITVKNEATGGALSAISLEPWGQISLTAAAAYRNISLVCGDEDFAWTAAGDLGTISPDGTFTSNGQAGSGSVTVSAGGRSVTIPLTVAGHIYTVENFEGGIGSVTGSGTVTVTQETRAEYIRFGRQSAKVAYSAADGANAALGLSLGIRPGEKYLSLWVYGDGSGNTLAASVRTADDRTEYVALAALSFTGWQQVTVPLPDGATGLLGLTVSTEKRAAGTIWLDQITSSNQTEPDTTPPTVAVTRSGNTLTAALSDNVERSFTREQITVTVDGRTQSFALNGDTVTAALSVSDGKAHRISVTAVDASGNIGRGSVDVAADEDHRAPFADMEGHWAQRFVNCLYDREIAKGSAEGGRRWYLPDTDITRGEFALMLARWMGLELSAYSSVELPFADTAAIPSWCLDAVKAMYTMGIMRGSSDGSGLCIYANSSITRAEAMTMLGRVQAKGYASAALTFADTASVPAWAADYMATMVARGVVSGREGNTIAPNAYITRGETAKLLYMLW